MPIVYLVAGGTGGHINAALSVGEEFQSEFDVRYISGLRYLDKKLFKGQNVTHIQSQPLRTKNPVKLILNIFKNLFSFICLFFLFLFERPIAVIGAGGYVCGPTLMAAKILLIPIFIIEQNAIMGLTNRLLSKFSNLIFLNFKETKGVKNQHKTKVVGNPIRKNIQFEKPADYSELDLLVFGGSLGAQQINQVIYKLIEKDFSFKLNVFHQVGKDSLSQTKTSLNVSYKQVEYIEDMQSAYAKSHIILARSGASTVSELRVVKRPSIIIPFPHATDNHQYYNALNLKNESHFPVEILDYNKSIDELTEAVYDALVSLKPEIESIIEKNSLDDSSSESASAVIKREVLANVRH